MILSKAEVPLPHVDICIVGAGPVGLALAFKLESSGLTVLLLEAGPKENEGIENSGAIDFLNTHHASPVSATSQGVGGTSALWGGRCVPYDDLDFDRRDHVPFSGWPFPHSEMERHYVAASSFLLCGPSGYGRRVEADGGDVMSDAIERWSRSPVLGPFYEERLKQSESIHLLTQAQVIGLGLDDAGTAVRELVVRHDGKDLRVEAGRFVLAAGGLEIARLLLATQNQHSETLGGRDGPLGRFYQGHLTGYLAVIHLTDQQLSRRLAFAKDEHGYRYRYRLQLAPAVQARERLLNSVFWLDSISISDPIHGSGALSMLYLSLAATGTYGRLSRGLAPRSGRMRKGEVLAHLRNIMREGPALGKFASLLRQVRRNNRGPALANPSGRYLLRYHAEQTPNAESRVQASDGAGRVSLSVDYRIAEQDIASVLQSHALLDGWLRDNSLGRLDYIHEQTERDKAVLSQAFDGYHQIGLARMSSDPRDGVVDPDCRVHGLSNLFLAGACVFPTGSHANPTLPAVALALRLGEHLVQSPQAAGVPSRP